MTIDSPWFHFTMLDQGDGPWVWYPWMGTTLVRFWWMRPKKKTQLPTLTN